MFDITHFIYKGIGELEKEIKIYIYFYDSLSSVITLHKICSMVGKGECLEQSILNYCSTYIYKGCGFYMH